MSPSSPQEPSAAPSHEILPSVRRGLFLLAWFAAALSCGLFVSFWGERTFLRDRLPRAVVVGELELGGQPEAAARRQLEAWAEAWAQRHLQLVTPSGRTVEVSTEALGLSLEVDRTVKEALRLGRGGAWPVDWMAWLHALVSPRQMKPQWSLDEAALLARVRTALASELRAPLLPSIRFDGELQVERGHGGTVLDVPELVRRVKSAAQSMLTTDEGPCRLSVPVRQRDQTVSDADVDRAVDRARSLVQFVFALELLEDAAGTVEGPPLVPGTLRLRGKRLASALRSDIVEEGGTGRLVLSLDAETLRRLLAPLLEGNEVEATSATFDALPSGRVKVVPARSGRYLDASALSAVIWRALDTSSREPIPIPFAQTQPDLTTAAAESLGVREVVSSFSTFHPCCQPRVHNIHTAAARLDGVVVRPGERFSLNDRLGPRSRAAGYQLAPTIVRGDMESVAGGGISQLATTLFNAVLRGGYEIVQRQPHSIYFSRYPEGHEATVSYPEPDLIFRNDTRAALVIRTYATPTAIRVVILGDDEGRRVSVSKSPRRDFVQPPVEYEADDTMDPEKTRRLRAGQLGFRVLVSRVVIEADGKKKEEKRLVTYSPRPERLRVHPCKIPEGADGHTGQECPEPEREEREEVLSEDTYYETVPWEMDEGG